MMRSLCLVSMVSMVSLVMACGDATTARVGEINALEGDAAAGQGLYETHCLACHGDDARSGTAGEDLPDEVGEETDEFIAVILGGKDNGAMPSFEATLSDQEIADILAFIATL